MKCFKNVLVYVDGEGLKKCTVSFDEKIEKIAKKEVKKAEEILLPAGAIVLPGFIDQHIHGAGGSDGMDGTLEDIATIAKTVAAEGTTSFLVTTMTQSPENITKALSAVKEYKAADSQEGARVVGVHLEGPFIAAAHKGAQPLQYVKEPNVEVFDEYNAASGNSIRIVTLAPEGNTTGENPTINLERNPPRNMNRGNKFLGNALTIIAQLLIRKYNDIITIAIEFIPTFGRPS
jgi:N-acetylglucosamine-6-phosphate deacetylase